MKKKMFYFIKSGSVDLTDLERSFVDRLDRSKIIDVDDKCLENIQSIGYNEDKYIVFIIAMFDISNYNSITKRLIEYVNDHECFLITSSSKNASSLGGFELKSIQDYIDNEISTYLSYINIMNKYIKDSYNKILYVSNNIRDMNYSSVILPYMIENLENNNLEFLALENENIKNVFDIDKIDFSGFPISIFKSDSNNNTKWISRKTILSESNITRDFLFNYIMFNIKLDTEKYLGTRIIDEEVSKQVILKDVEEQLSKYIVPNYIYKYSVDNILISHTSLSYEIYLDISIYLSSTFKEYVSISFTL